MYNLIKERLYKDGMRRVCMGTVCLMLTVLTRECSNDRLDQLIKILTSDRFSLWYRLEKLRVYLLKSRLVTSTEAGSILWEWFSVSAFSFFASLHLNRDVGDERVVAARRCSSAQRGTEVHALVIYWICLERQVVYLMQGNRLSRQSNSMWLRPGTDHNPKADCGVWVFFHWAGLRCKSSKLKYMCISNEEHSLPHKQHRKRSNIGRLAASECTNTGLDSVSVLWLSANK